jgi:uncharacterized protein (DUF2147 family)
MAPAQEISMKKLLAIAAFLLASSAAQAQYSFEYGGKTIRIDPDRGTVSIPGVYNNSGRPSKRSRSDQDSDRPRKQTKGDPQTTPDTTTSPPADQTAAPATTTPPAPATATVAPTDATTPPPNDVIPALRDPDVTPAKPAPPAAVATAPSPPPVQQTPVAAGNSPLGMWLTEKKEGKVRIEPCGPNLCGYAVDDKSDKNGEQVLINMKPGQGKWSGQILDPKSGSTYDSTIALKGSDTLQVQGCALGGMFCGGQTWTRVN